MDATDTEVMERYDAPEVGVPIVVTRWGLDTYLDLKEKRVFDETDYRTILRPDIRRLHNFGTDSLFESEKFWGPAVDRSGNLIKDGWKMKWHNLGNGRVQLRLCVALIHGDAYLCDAYVKDSPQTDQRFIAKFKSRIELIRQGVFTERGRIK